MHVQSCCFAYKTYCFLTLSFPSASLDLKVPNVSKTCHRVFRGSRSDLIIMLYSYQIVHVPEKDLTTPLCLKIVECLPTTKCRLQEIFLHKDEDEVSAEVCSKLKMFRSEG